VITVGADSHKRTHTVVAVDQVGRRVGEKTVRTNSDGHLELLGWARRLADDLDDGDVTFALEDCRHLTRRLEADLLAGDGRVVRVPTRLMAETRKVSREPGKSDPIDAYAMALAALRHPELPIAELDGPAREVKLLSDHRRDLVGQRTRICCQVRWFLQELDPDLDIMSRGLRRQSLVSELLVEWTASTGSWPG
jgi:transposase